MNFFFHLFGVAFNSIIHPKKLNGSEHMRRPVEFYYLNYGVNREYAVNSLYFSP